MGTKDYTEADIAAMTDEELAAYEAEGEGPDGSAAHDDDADDAGDTAGGDTSAADTAATDTAGDDAADTETGSDREAPFIPQYQPEVPADAEAQITAARESIGTLKAEERAAFTKLMAGDSTPEEYEEVRARVDAGIETAQETVTDLRTKVREAEMFERANATATEQVLKREWDRAVDRFMTGAANGESIDYRGKPALLAAFNTNLRTIASKQENADKDADWLLSEAHKATKSDLGITATRKKVADTDPNAARRVDKSKIPPTLRSVPTAADVSTGDNEFAHLDKLSGEEQEKALARMTPDQQERWANG